MQLVDCKSGYSPLLKAIHKFKYNIIKRTIITYLLIKNEHFKKADRTCRLNKFTLSTEAYSKFYHLQDCTVNSVSTELHSVEVSPRDITTLDLKCHRYFGLSDVNRKSPV